MKTEKLILVLAMLSFGFSAISCSKKASYTVTNRALSHDFVLSTLLGSGSPLGRSNLVDNQDCLEYVTSVTCFSEKEQSGFDPNCSFKEISPQTVSKISDLIETLSPFHQKVFCHINRLQLHTKIRSIAYAGFIQNEQGSLIGNMIGFRIDAFKEGSSDDLFSWKEQLNFGLSNPDDPLYTISKLGPRIILEISEVKEHQLFYVLVHEISHLIDFMNNANTEDCTASDDVKNKKITCSPKDNSFSKISWPSNYSFLEDGSDWPPRETRELYPWLSQLCYYACNPPISPDYIRDIYHELSESQFVTPYSSTNQYEDFADASTAFVLKPSGYLYKIVDGDNNVLFDLDSNWETDQLKAKKKWLKDFYSRSDLKYRIEPSLR